jgi:hypothetical protein
MYMLLACPPNWTYLPACLPTSFYMLCLPAILTTFPCLLVCSLPVSICFFVSGCIFLPSFLCLCICLSVSVYLCIYPRVFLAVLRIRDAVMQILIPLFTLMRIRIRIWILIKVIKSAITGLQTPQAQLWASEPSIAPFKHPQLLNFDSDPDPDLGFGQK